MNNNMWLKSLFISSYLTLAFATLIWSGWQAWQGQSLSHLALSLTALPISVFMLYLFVGGAPRTGANLPMVSVPTLIFAALAVFYSLQKAQLEILVLAVVLAVAAVLYIFWYSRFSGRLSSPLVVGEALPQFELQHCDGGEFRSSDVIGQPALFIFYRGNWCPLCMAQIKEVAGQYQQLEQRGVRTYLVSSQSHANSAGLAKRFAVNFNFMVDVDNAAAKALKIDAVGGTPTGLQGLGYESDTAMPTVVMTNAEGRVIFADLTDNYRVRPEPETFLQVLDQAQTA